ncbi:lignostilbene-alpha,beta-dioxygenase-like enzyme [Pleurocapsa sp. PCC 7327]|uniref:carotenoid oxygenase family protein n=1 Tax=Pleurocapsa sp. PCC 7327 TaxID=118163 RepID=UPI00029FBB45|nr:carotenoid oxygenase family protein [Pleurocapsa sp. PCC 7327]AFY78205.1 lignostilbene-alpha,beta-dioxygenase-like enzyme [Pleurocapsa sp. PCC 7327]
MLSSDRKAWSKAIEKPAQEFPLTPLPVLYGKIPQGLRGSFYRNGPGRLERGGMRVGHWFDGDGAVLAIHFTDAGASGVYRYVQTKGYQKETAANKFLFPNYGMKAPGAFWTQWGKEFKNCANTSVMALPNKLLALWEGGNPYALNLQTLETIGTDNLSSLNKSDPFSAHPKIDPQTGAIYNFGVVAELNATLNLYQSNSTGKIVKKTATQLEGVPLIHDFVMAGQYLIFFVSPVRINFLPPALGLSSFSDAMQWKPELGTQVLVFDRNTLSLVSRGEADPWFQWHFGNGYTDTDGSLVIVVARYRDFQTNQNLKEVATGKIETPAKATLWQISLNPQTGKVISTEEVLDKECEFPTVAPHQVGQPWRYSYLSTHRDGANSAEELFGAIARFDRKTSNLSIADPGENCYPSEPIFVPNGPNSEEGWVLTVVYDGNSDTSEVRIYRCDRLEDEPICCLGLPSVVPHGFHGTWKPA